MSKLLVGRTLDLGGRVYMGIAKENQHLARRYGMTLRQLPGGDRVTALVRE
jgi:hypothetical protein